MKMYEISEDLRQIDELFSSAVDENGEPRELTSEESEFLKNCLCESSEQFKEKFDNYGRYLSNLKAQSDCAEAELKTLQSEEKRLRSRATAFDSRRKSLLEYIKFNLKNIGLDSYKTALYSIRIQKAPEKVELIGNSEALPDEFKKPCEMSSSAIRKAIKDGNIKIIGDTVFYKGEEIPLRITPQDSIVLR